MRHGWFVIPGVQSGDRTLEEQLVALQPALEACRGKTVLDLGCAEGLIAREFVRAGAAKVLGVESVDTHLQVAREVCKGTKGLAFMAKNLNRLPPVMAFDFVLALGVIHKLHDPERGLRWAAACARELLLVRSGRGERDRDGIIHSKHRPGMKVDRDAVLKECGFVYERTVEGPPEREEDVQYWRKR